MFQGNPMSWELLVLREQEFRAPILSHYCQGVAQLVARSVRDAEAVGSSPITLTIFVVQKYFASWEPELRFACKRFKSDHPDQARK